MWKRVLSISLFLVLFCFSPLAGINYVETLSNEQLIAACIAGFSPLAGINYVETDEIIFVDITFGYVSVPLRGLIMWKHRELQSDGLACKVSVPLRGLIMWKL